MKCLCSDLRMMGSTPASRGVSVVCWLLAALLPFIVLGDSCHKVKLVVPDVIFSGALVGKADLNSCLHPNEVIVRTNNPKFVVERVGSHYAIYSTERIAMDHHTLTIGLLRVDLSSMKENVISVKLLPATRTGKSRFARELLRRTKRRWRLSPFSVYENYVGKFPAHVQQIQSDTMVDYEIFYSISGPGVDQPPVGLFQINPVTGDIYITGPVDREEYPFFKMMAFAKTKDGFAPEFPLDMTVVVEDDNDNAPIFTEEKFCTEVLEHCKSGTVVGRVNATDRDDPRTRHALLRYYLLQQIPPTSPPLFAVSAEYGIITTTSNKLDRELIDQYTLILEVRDMGGDRLSGLSSTGTMVITILDINDNPPTFTQQSYQVEVNENESGMVILRIPITDKDLVNTPNWRAVYAITQGNEKGCFNISTDPNTNEGLLRVVKGLNYEEMNRYLLQVSVVNEVSLITLSGTKTHGGSSIPVTIIVRDVDEGPECQPRVKVVTVPENQTIGTLLTETVAIDPETKSSAGIRYSKLSDPLSWVNIDGTSGRITTAAVLDYESHNVPSHQYNVTYLATDQSGKSSTCTLSINVRDINDNYPGTGRIDSIVCSNARSVVEVEAQGVGLGSSAPYTFTLDTSKNPHLADQWRIVKQDGKSVQLQEIGNLPVGFYEIPLNIRDKLGQAMTQTVTVRKCDCLPSMTCDDRSATGNTALGGLAILVMVLSAILFAVLLCLLLACLCGSGAGKGKIGFPDDTVQQNLIVTNTEAPGADVMDQNFKVPIHLTNPNLSGKTPSGSYDQGDQNMHQNVNQNIHQVTQTKRSNLQSAGASHTLQSYRGGGAGAGHQMHMVESGRHTYAEWQSFMNSHLGDKLYMCGQDEEHQRGEDYVLPYTYEGKGSVAGSVGCCSDVRGDDDRMDFLNTLEPKFRTLADVCAKK